MTPQPGKALKGATDRRQRRHARYRAEFPLGVSVFSGEQHVHFAAHSRDLSTAGIGALVAAELSVGDVASLAFSLPGGQPWDVRAVLRYRRGYHYGFEFFTLSDEQRKALAEYLQRLELTDSAGEAEGFRRRGETPGDVT